MYIPPECLDVLKEALTRVFEPPPEVAEAIEGTGKLRVHDARRHARTIVEAARCAASLAMCGGAQLTELSRHLYDHRVDPGFFTACEAARVAAREKDERERAEATRTLERLEVATTLCASPSAALCDFRAAAKAAGLPSSGSRADLRAVVDARGPAMRARLSERLGRAPDVSGLFKETACPVRPHLRALVVDLVAVGNAGAAAAAAAAEADEPFVANADLTQTISLIDAMFLYRLPVRVLQHLPSVTNVRGCPPISILEKSSSRLWKGYVLSIALSRAVAKAHAADPSSASGPFVEEEDRGPAFAHFRTPGWEKRLRQVDVLVRTLFPDDPPERLGDCKTALAESDHAVASAMRHYVASSSLIKHSAVRARLQAAVIEAERRRALNEESFEETFEKSLIKMGSGSSNQADANATEFASVLRHPAILTETQVDDLKRLWIADVDRTCGRPSQRACLEQMRDRMDGLVWAIDENTIPVGHPPDVGTLSDILGIPRGTDLWRRVAIAHVQCSLRLNLAPPRGPPHPQPRGQPQGQPQAEWTAVAMLEQVHEALVAFRRSSPHATTYERLKACSMEGMLSELTLFRCHTLPTCSCPSCPPSSPLRFTFTYGLLSHILVEHWKPFLPAQRIA
jgi:hypothetical protein